MSIPITALRGLVLPGPFTFDGRTRFGWRKDRVKRLFSLSRWFWEWAERIPEWLSHIVWFELGLNVYTIKRRPGLQRYRPEAIRMLNRHYDGKLKQWRDLDDQVGEWDLGDDNWLCPPHPSTDMLMIEYRSRIDGGYIGGPETALTLLRRGIQPQKANHKGKTCSIGFCEREQKWYGWSHRAMYGFKVGDEVKEGSCCATSGWTDEYLEQHPDADVSLPVGFKAANLDDCRRMAVAFAESVS
ncbi:MAG: hypothetical protein ACR2QF_11885 [Geminicoccaceae bacterium]